MSLDPLSEWKASIDSLPPASAIPDGVQNLAVAIANHQDDVQAGSTGTVGILTTDSSTFAAQLATMTPTGGTDWVDTIVAAWSTAMAISVITPGTVTDPAWTASAVDVLTLPLASSTIVTLSVAADKLKADLMVLANAFQGDGDPEVQNNATEHFAAAFRNATLEFQFNCIGLVIGVPPVPLPKIFSAL